MISRGCCHSRGLGPEDPIHAAAECFVGPDQIVAGHAMANLAFSQCIERATVGSFRARCASHSRQSRLERSIYAVLIVWLGDFSQSRQNLLLASVDHLTFDLDHLRTLARLVNSGRIQISINDPFWIPGPRRFARRRWRGQFVKQLAQDCAVM